MLRDRTASGLGLKPNWDQRGEELQPAARVAILFVAVPRVAVLALYGGRSVKILLLMSPAHRKSWC